MFFDMYDRILLDRPLRLQNMGGEYGEAYGYEWSRDSFDDFSDLWLIKKYSTGQKSKPSELPSALDIGCGGGQRVQDLMDLGIFGRIDASDIILRQSFTAAASELLRHHLVEPPRFVKKPVTELEPADFADKLFDYINFRRVAHFLSPQDFQQAIKNIALLAAEGAFVTLSFDGGAEAQADVIDLRCERQNFYTDSDLNYSATPYIRYSAASVEDFMEQTGFKLITDDSFRPTQLRPLECHIAALAPGS